MDNDFEIQGLDAIVAIRILLNTYDIDVQKWTKEECEQMIRLLQIVVADNQIW